MSNSILFLGPRIGNQKNIGGIVVLFEDLIDYCDKGALNYIVIDTNLSNYSNFVFGLISISFKFIRNVNKVKHISLHGSARDYIYLAPFVLIVSKIFKKKISLRKFAGSFYEIYLNSNFFKKKIIGFILNNSDYLFFETKFLVDKFKSFNDNTFWWPNSRPKTNLLISGSFNKKFVFISQVKKTKGIYEFINAASKLDNSFVLDIYGPIFNPEIKLKISENFNINYKGIISPSEVLMTLMSYDVLVLPTYHDGEGYPGIILEAFSIGMPVISTKWNSIPEIVSHNENGILVPIKDVDCLTQEILNFNQNKYNKLRINAISSFDEFDSELVNYNFFKKINLIEKCLIN